MIAQSKLWKALALQLSLLGDSNDQEGYSSLSGTDPLEGGLLDWVIAFDVAEHKTHNVFLCGPENLALANLEGL